MQCCVEDNNSVKIPLSIMGGGGLNIGPLQYVNKLVRLMLDLPSV